MMAVASRGSMKIHHEYYVDDFKYYDNFFNFNITDSAVINKPIAAGAYIDECHYMAIENDV